MNSCGVQRVVLGTFKGLMTAFVVLDLPPWMAFVAELLAGVWRALAIFAGGNLVFDFTDFVGEECAFDADARAMVNS
jgi:hypothetical protein